MCFKMDNGYHPCKRTFKNNWSMYFPNDEITLEICDMIKGNESDVGNIDFELQVKKDDKFLCFTLF